MSWEFLTNNNDEREAMDIGITRKSSSARFKHRYFCQSHCQGVHKIKTTLFSISLPKLHELQSLTQESTNYDYESAEYRVTAIILDTAQYGLFRPVRSDLLNTDARTHFIKLDFINKGIDAVN